MSNPRPGYRADGKPIDRCECGKKFTDAEDYRDHLPCPAVRWVSHPTVLPELRDLIPPPSPEELAALEAELVRDGGPRDPLTTWARGGSNEPDDSSTWVPDYVLIDGHNRLAICQKHGLPYRTVALHFGGIAAVRAWMFANQVARRNLSVSEVLVLAAKIGVPTDRGTKSSRLHAEAIVKAGKADRVLVDRLSIPAVMREIFPPKPKKRAARAPAVAADPVERTRDKRAAAAAKSEAESLAREVASLRDILAAREALSRAPVDPIERVELGRGVREATWVAMLSDFHVEERVRASDTPTGNVYNLAIAEHRLGRFFAGVEWLVNFHKEAFSLRHGLCWLGGDLFSGHIHEENVETSALTPLMSCAWLKPRLIGGLERLLDSTGVERLIVPCSYGNHGRDTKKSRRSTGAEHSYEYALYLSIEEHFRTVGEKRIQFEISPSGHQYVEIYDRTSHFHHGDEIAYGGGVGGISIPINKATHQWDRVRPSHIHHYGHFHQFLDGGHWLVNGSGIGYNGYAMSIKASPEPPRQGFYLQDSKRSKTCVSPIWVGDPSGEAELVHGI